jgi:endoglucanase
MVVKVGGRGGRTRGRTDTTPPVSLAWQESDRLQIGLNCMQPFGFAGSSGGSYVASPFVNGGADTTVLPDARLSGLRSAGFDFVRMAVDVGPLMAADSSSNVTTTVLDGLIGQIVTGVGRRTAQSLKVIVDLHPLAAGQHPVTGWDAASIIARTALTDTKWVRYKFVAARLAAALQTAGASTSMVCIELFNEPPAEWDMGSVAWPEQAVNLWQAVRAACSYTLVIGGNDYNNIDHQLSGTAGNGTMGLTPASFDGNTGFSFHPYESSAFSHQGVASTIYQYMHGLTFPASGYPGGLSQAKADFTTAAGGDSNAINSVVTQTGWYSSLDRYFSEFGTKALLATRLGTLTAWADAAGISRKRLFNTEFGVSFGGADTRPTAGDAYLADAAAWIQAHRENADEAGINCITLHELQGSDFGISETATPYSIPSSIKGALGFAGTVDSGLPLASNLLSTNQSRLIGWTGTNTTITTGNTNTPEGGTLGATVIEAATTVPHYAEIFFTHSVTASVYEWSALVKPLGSGATRGAMMWLFDGGFARQASVGFNLSTGAINVSASAAGGFTSASGRSVYVADGWWRLTLQFTAAVTSNFDLIIGPTTGGGVNYAGDGASGIRVAQAHLIKL